MPRRNWPMKHDPVHDADDLGPVEYALMTPPRHQFLVGGLIVLAVLTLGVVVGVLLASR